MTTPEPNPELTPRQIKRNAEIRQQAREAVAAMPRLSPEAAKRLAEVLLRVQRSADRNRSNEKGSEQNA